MQYTFFYAVLMIIAGLGIPTMASLNAGLGDKLQNSLLAVTILNAVAFSVAAFVLILTQGLPKTLYVPGTPKYLYFGGALFVFYIFSVTWVIPKFGVANAIGLVLFGQLIAMVTIDHLGLFGLVKYQIDLKRFLGLIFMALGVFLVVSKRT